MKKATRIECPCGRLLMKEGRRPSDGAIEIVCKCSKPVTIRWERGGVVVTVESRLA